MKNVEVEKIIVSGELCQRADKNFDRLEASQYQVPNVFKGSDYKWPGDIEGRTMLALVVLSRATHRTPRFLDEILKEIPGQLNEKGYFGPILPEGTLNEQQISGNNWALRAFIEYYSWKKESWALDIIQSMVKNLLLPARGYYEKYPVIPEQRVFAGGVEGDITGKVGHWITSTDIGCAFIMLDGAAQAYQLLKDSELKALLEEMIRVFVSIDFVKLSCQTHATLSALRGILRFYSETGEKWLLEEVQRIYSLYREEACTENYANYNWFGRPTWTEPCAVVDSFIVVLELWRLTRNVAYLEDAHHIWYNAIGHGQRPNGGFGTDMCLGARDEFLSKGPNKFEAAHCCTMRGGEGLEKAIGYLYFLSGEEIILPFYNDSTVTLTFEDGEIILQQRTTYPMEGYVNLEILHSTVRGNKNIKIFVPTWVNNETISLKVDGKNCVVCMDNHFIAVEIGGTVVKKIEMRFDILLRTEGTHNKHSIQGYHSYRHGTLLLGMENHSEPVSLNESEEITYLGNGKYQIVKSNQVLSPINDMLKMTEQEGMLSRKQVLFRRK